VGRKWTGCAIIVALGGFCLDNGRTEGEGKEKFCC